MKPSAENNFGGKTSNYQDHIPSSIGLYFKDRFCRELLKVSEFILECLENPLFPDQNLSAAEEAIFQNSKTCHICKLNFNVDDAGDDDYKVRDHCHSTGEFRGAAHSKCNLNYRDNFTIPIAFHNLSCYDAHFIMLKINDIITGGLDVLAVNTERYISGI